MELGGLISRVMRALLSLLLASLVLTPLACSGGEEPAPSNTGSGDNTPAEQGNEPENTPPPAEEPETPAETPEEAPEETPAEEASSPHSAEAIAAADAKYKAVCATCHGQSGKGDAPAAANFPVKPRDYSDKEWQATVTDEYLAKAIVEGGAAVGKSPLMPASPDLKDKPEVLAALVAKIRGFAAE